jgi:PleD family two-component response regulator
MEGGLLRVTASIGLASLREGESAESLIERSDQAMYAAKVGGRNRLVVSQQEVATVTDRARARTG